MTEPYGDPAVDALIPEIRAVIVANCLNGDGNYTQRGTDLADEIAGIIAVWVAKRERKPDGWPDGMEMIRQLREAVGLFSGAMSITPSQAWEEALIEVRRLR